MSMTHTINHGHLIKHLFRIRTIASPFDRSHALFSQRSPSKSGRNDLSNHDGVIDGCSDEPCVLPSSVVEQVSHPPHDVRWGTMVGYQPNDIMTTNQKLIAGCISGMTTRFITQPLDLLKLRVQLQKRSGKRTLIARTARKIIKEEGVTAFWHGHNLGQIHSVFAVSAQFYVYELSTTFVAQHFDKTYAPYANFLCGIVAGLASATLVNPMEVIRVRQMIQPTQYRGVVNGARQVYKSGGILAFYGGLTASLLQMGPAVGISFGTFRLIQPLVLGILWGSEDYHGIYGNRYQAAHLAIATTIAGSAAGFASKTLTYPFELAKRRLQIATHVAEKGGTVTSTTRSLFKCRTLSECLLKTVEREGFPGLFRGWKVTVLKAQLTSVVAFTSYEMACYIIRELQTD